MKLNHVRLVAFLTVLLQTFVAGERLSAEPRSNVLFIAIDDLNDWVGCLDGHTQAKTPNIDRLAARGMLFTNAHCQAPICGPSRASLLSGRYPHTTGVYQQPRGSAMENDEEHFRDQLLSEYFAGHGYRTLAVGKITHGYSPQVAFQEYGGNFSGSGPKPPNAQRFNYFLPDVPWTGTQTDWGAFPDSDAEMTDHMAATWAIDQLEREQTQPFFLAVGFVRPHVPFYVPQEWFDAFSLDEIQLPAVRNDDLDDVPEIGQQIHEMPKYPSLSFLQDNDNEQFRKCVQAYLACTIFVDHQVGRVLDALERSEYADNTVIVLFSDHGYHLGEKDRVSKHSLWEEATRVPMIVVPARTDSLFESARGRQCSQPVGLIDLYPTLTDLCEVTPNPSNEGRTLRPLLADAGAQWRHSVLTTYARGNHAVRSERYRYIRYEDGSEEFYDHMHDPNEWTNLAHDPAHSEWIRRLREEIPATEAAYHKSTSPAPVNRWFDEHLKNNGVNRSPR